MIIMMIFQHVNFIFCQIFISLFRGLFKDETDLRVKVVVSHLFAVPVFSLMSGVGKK